MKLIFAGEATMEKKNSVDKTGGGRKPVRIRIGDIEIGAGRPLVMIAGPCVIESRRACIDMALRLAGLAADEGIPLIFKASYDKANRTSLKSYRGPGLEAGLGILAEARERSGLPVLTDVHSPAEAVVAAESVDVLQVPAFLCRQTDLVVAAGETGRVVNIKKGQFMSPWDMAHVTGKVEGTGNRKIILTERGVSFGYNNLVADMRSLAVMRESGYPVVFDATHSVQRPGGCGGTSGGDGKWAPLLARAAVAAGCDGVFIETHIAPDRALSDGANMIRFSALRPLWRGLKAIHDIV